MNWDKIGTFVQTVGVPTAIAFYILIRLEPAINSNTMAIHQLALAIQALGK